VKIGLDAQLMVGTATGIGEYVRGLLGALREAGADVVELAEPKLDPWRFDRRVMWDQVLLPQRARAEDVDVLHCASGTIPLSAAMPVVATVHDVAWLRVQTHTRPYARYYFGKFSVDRYRRAQAIAVDSEFSRRELLEVVPEIDPERVRVVYPGVAQDYCTLERQHGDGRTILVVGTVERRKNLEFLIDALRELPQARIVSVGPSTSYQDECAARAVDLGVSDRLEFRGYVSREELLSLYASCAVVAMPSRYEGFGYGAAQALCAGAPLLVSDQASLPEIVDGDAMMLPLGDVSIWIDPLRAALRGDLDDRARTARPRAVARFAWAKSAHDMMRIYELALST
jgi:glycosyltransferase involved in cell wall biosynthesis